MLLEDAYVPFLVQHDLTQSQYLLLHLIYKKRHDLIRLYKEKFPADDSSMIGQRLTQELFDKNWLVKKGNIVEVSEKYLSAFINKHTAAEEIFSIYPAHWNNNGTIIPLSAMDRNVFANLYDRAIQGSIVEHIEVTRDIQYAIQYNLLNIGIERFVKSQYWSVIRPIRLANVIKESIPSIRDHEF